MKTTVQLLHSNTHYHKEEPNYSPEFTPKNPTYVIEGKERRQTKVNKQQIMVQLDKAHNILQLRSSYGLFGKFTPGHFIP